MVLVSTVGICVSLPTGSVPTKCLGRCERWHESRPQGRHRHHQGPEHRLRRGWGRHSQCTEILPAARGEVSSEPCTPKVKFDIKKKKKKVVIWLWPMLLKALGRWKLLSVEPRLVLSVILLINETSLDFG